MPLSIGTVLGPYQILAPIGAGGMGEVYRARDTKLGRDVAIKVLPAAFANDADRLARFQREAQVLASLNHPHIAAIYGLEESEGVRALVMEFVEGPTLADRIAAGPMPLDDALPIARQIAEALEAAHEKGIVHRDLKPANVKISAEGKAKVLDFGLAAVAQASGCDSDPANSPTLTLSATRAGVILGTAGYMAPEQARGTTVDKRADIWAFGVVLFEMLTGRQTFTGETVSDTLAAVLRAELDWSALPAGTPPVLCKLLRRCLERDRKKRLRDIGDALAEIDEAGQPAETLPVPAKSSPSRALARAAAAAVLLIAASALAIIHFTEKPPAERSARFQIAPPEKAPNFTNLFTAGPAVISPDGKQIAFVAGENPSRDLICIRDINAFAARPLQGTDQARFPFWSPDSRFLAFFTNDKLKKIEVAGGPPQTICDAANGRGGTWSRDDVIVFAPGPRGPLFRILAAGGAPTPVTSFDPSLQESTHRWPVFLPDCRHFLYHARGTSATSGIYLGSLDSPQRKRVLLGRTNALYSPAPGGQDGHLLFVRETTLMAERFDPKRLELTGDAFPVVEKVALNASNTIGDFSVSSAGLLVYRAGESNTSTELAWFDRSGKKTEVVAPQGYFTSPTLSFDGKKLAVEQYDTRLWTTDAWVWDLARRTSLRLTFSPGYDAAPLFSPDGGQVLFRSLRDNVTYTVRKAATGVGEEEVLWKSTITSIPSDWSRDGRFLLYTEGDAKTLGDLWVLPLAPGSDRKPVLYLKTESSKRYAKFSPDGKYVAYVSDESGRPEVYVQTFPATGGKWQVSTGGGTQPRWHADGKEIFYLAADRKLMAAPVRSSPAFELGTPFALFETRLLPDFILFFRTEYDVTADGKRFLLNSPLEAASSAPISVVLNWRVR